MFKFRIALHIRDRIIRAYKNKEKFRVFIFLPLLPGFPGNVYDTVTLQLIIKYTYKTISRNNGLSLIEKLHEVMGDQWQDYLTFFSLRAHGIINTVPKTELIYVHSKIIIVDDTVALIGSANINDRSMLGSRDSEVGVIIRDKPDIESLMNGQHYYASNFAHTLRIRLFKEHLGFNSSDIPDILIDPLDDKMFAMMKQLAKSNSFYFREIFNCYPDDKFVKLSDTMNVDGDESDIEGLKEKYQVHKNKIIGNIVEFPLNFLKDENLRRTYFCKEILVPIKNFL